LIYDLHTHSNASDGILSPAALVSRAKAQGVTHLALTDHDTVQGLQDARAQAELEGLTLLNGVELSCLWSGRGIHVVGLNVDPLSESLRSALDAQRQARFERAREIGARLAKLGIEGAYEGATALAGEGVVGRPHFARYLVERGYSANINSAFKQYLGAGKPGDVKQIWPDIAGATATIVAAGGVAVLAHPLKYTLTLTKLRTLVAGFKEAGGQAIEVVSGQQQVNETATLVNLARLFDLHASCGSDFHLPDQPWQELGKFTPLPESCRPVWRLWQ
jgi:predicted metal-dependent phosphoesterase TrpH